MGVHEGHRERLKESFDQHGLAGFNDLNALELLLFYAIPRRDTNELAHRLLERFGSLEEIFGATDRQLMDVPGVGKNTALLLRLVPAMMRKTEISKANREITIIRNSDDAGRYLVPRFTNESVEVLWMMCLNAAREIVFCEEINRGIVNAVDTNIRRLVETALRYKATRVIVAHNHPHGLALPSREDDMFTKKLYDALRILDITLEDHIIVTGKEFVSLADSGVFSMYRF